ncbi:MAG: hypothetical protein M5R36_05505 [Deltaproteobacteria bacterium]|nr:hypothetical protein [Deltaproteobacteria bacterium]
MDSLLLELSKDVFPKARTVKEQAIRDFIQTTSDSIRSLCETAISYTLRNIETIDEAFESLRLECEKQADATATAARRQIENHFENAIRDCRQNYDRWLFDLETGTENYRTSKFNELLCLGALTTGLEQSASASLSAMSSYSSKLLSGIKLFSLAFNSLGHPLLTEPQPRALMGTWRLPEFVHRHKPDLSKPHQDFFVDSDEAISSFIAGAVGAMFLGPIGLLAFLVPRFFFAVQTRDKTQA